METLVLLDGAPAVLVAHVVGGDVENHRDAGAVEGVDEVLEVLEGTHGGVATEEIVDVILVIGCPPIVVDALVVLLDAADPDGGHAQILQIGDFGPEAVPVAAVVVVAVIRIVDVVAFPTRLVVLEPVDAIGGETVGKQLVDVAVPPLLGAGRVGIIVSARHQGVGAGSSAIAIPRVFNCFIGPCRRCRHRGQADSAQQFRQSVHRDFSIMVRCRPFYHLQHHFARLSPPFQTVRNSRIRFHCPPLLPSRVFPAPSRSFLSRGAPWTRFPAPRFSNASPLRKNREFRTCRNSRMDRRSSPLNQTCLRAYFLAAFLPFAAASA